VKKDIFGNLMAVRFDKPPKTVKSSIEKLALE
jgi:hypothetical protein